MWLVSLKQSLLDLAFPKICVGCKKQGNLICETCWPKVQLIYTQMCPICATPSIGGLTHPKCKTPHSLDGLVSLAYYQGPVRSLIRQLKYHGATVTTELIGQLLDEYLKHESLHLPPAILTPIPLHRSSHISRGFNQSNLIAREVSNKTHLPVVEDVLIRAIQHPSQTKLSKADRQHNVIGVFEVTDRQAVKGATFILVDDVFTTGATLREAAKVLKRAGASQVWGLTLAREG